MEGCRSFLPPYSSIPSSLVSYPFPSLLFILNFLVSLHLPSIPCHTHFLNLPTLFPSFLPSLLWSLSFLPLSFPLLWKPELPGGPKLVDHVLNWLNVAGRDHRVCFTQKLALGRAPPPPPPPPPPPNLCVDLASKHFN